MICTSTSRNTAQINHASVPARLLVLVLEIDLVGAIAVIALPTQNYCLTAL